MKKRFWIQIPMLLCLAVMSAALCGCAAIETRREYADGLPLRNAGITGVPLAESYTVGDTLDLSAAKVEADGVSYDCDKFLLRPDGVTERGNTFLLQQAGAYTVRLQATAEGRPLVFKKQFIAYQPYGAFYSPASKAELTNDGVSVSLVSGDTLSLQTMLDMAALPADGGLIRIRIDSQTAGTADFTRMDLRFTDVDNPDNFLRVRFNGYDWGTYILAGASGQPLTGYESWQDKLHRNNEWGEFLNHTFFGDDKLPHDFEIRYDASTRELFAANNVERVRIIDLDSPDYFSNLWSGFIGRRVSVSISASGYVSSEPARFTVLSLGGRKPTDALVKDTDAPAVTVQCDRAQLPKAEVGKPFRLFDATAFDIGDGKVAVNVKVMRKHSQHISYDVDSLNGAFTPDETGVYAIVYTATDRAGNRACETVEIEAVEKLYPLTITAVQNAERGELGRRVPIAAYLTAGGSGQTKVTVRVRYRGREIECIDGGFTPTEQGVYDIVYEAEDYIGNRAAYVCNFEAVPSTQPVLREPPALPRYFIKGKSYVIPAGRAIDYASGTGVEFDCDVSLTATDRQEITAGQSVKMDFDVTAVTLTYTAASTVLYEKTVPLIDVGVQGALNLAGYFDCGDGLAAAATDNGISISASKRGDVTFIREVLAEEMLLRFSVNPKLQVGNRIDVTLTDSVDRSQSVKASFVRSGDGTQFSVDGAETVVLNNCGFTEDSLSNDFYLAMSGGKLSPAANRNYEILRYTDGRPFVGFTSGKVYITLTIDGTVWVRHINGQTFNTADSDRIRPQIVVLGDYGGEYSIGETVELAAVAASDVLDPEIICTVTVEKPDRTFAVADGGIVLDSVAPAVYRFTVDMYGTYIVRYTARDSNNGQQSTRTYNIVCNDKIAPEVAFGQTGLSGRVGTAVAIPAITVSDNLTPVEQIAYAVYVTAPDGSNIRLTDGVNAFIPKTAGIYRITCVAYDEAGNLGICTVTARIE